MKARILLAGVVVATLVGATTVALSGHLSERNAAPRAGLPGTTATDRVRPVGQVNLTHLALAAAGTRAVPSKAPADFPEIDRAEILARFRTALAHQGDPNVGHNGAVDNGTLDKGALDTGQASDKIDPQAIQTAVSGVHPPDATVDTTSGVGDGFQGVGIVEMEAAGTGQYAGTNGGLEPPDQALCVGNGFVLEGVNTAWKVYGTDGTPKAAAVPITQFFHLPPASQPGGSSFVSDPRCLYDAQSKRFFALTLEADEASGITQIPFLRAHTYFAVSKTSDPTGDWDIFNIDVTDDGQNGTPLHASCPCIDDQPLMGIDANGLYLTANEFSDSEIFPVPVPGQVNQVFNNLPDYRLGQAQAYALSKADLLTGKTPKMQSFDTADIPVPAADQGTPGAVWSELQPASSPPGDTSGAATGGAEYFMSQLDFAYTSDHRIAVWAMTNTSSLASKPDVHLQNTVINTLHDGDVYGAPVYGVDQKDGPHPLADACGCPEEQLNANDDRMNQVMLTNNTLWGALNTALPAANAKGSGADADPRAGVMYFHVQPAIDATGNITATMLGDGYIQVPKDNVVFPSIAASPAGPVAAFFTLTGVDYYPSAAFARLDGVADGQAPVVTVVGAGTRPEDGFSGYPTAAQLGVPVDTDSGKPVARWGDYSAAGVDEQGCLWGAAEYIPDGARDEAAGNWNTYVMRVQPSGCSESTFPTGAAAQNINPCGPLFIDAKGDDVQNADLVPVPGSQGQNPQLDIVKGNIGVSADGTTVSTVLRIADLSTTLPSGGEANEYYFYWTHNGIEYFSNVEIDASGAATYSDGTVDPSGRTFRSGGPADTGTITPGTDGRIVVNVPASAVGSPKTGDLLTGGNAETRELEGALVLQYDAAGPAYDYAVGETCAATP